MVRGIKKKKEKKRKKEKKEKAWNKKKKNFFFFKKRLYHCICATLKQVPQELVFEIFLSLKSGGSHREKRNLDRGKKSKKKKKEKIILFWVGELIKKKIHNFTVWSFLIVQEILTNLSLSFLYGKYFLDI